MGNTVTFKLDGVSEILTGLNVRIFSDDRNIIAFKRDQVSDAAGNITVELGNLGSSGQRLLIYCDDFNANAPAGTNHKFAASKGVVTSPAWYDPETKVINPSVVIPEGEVIN